MSIINISNQNIAGDCNLKCSYIFDYHNSSVSATNSGFSIDLTYDKSYISPVIYNNNKYQVQSISIYSPSIHLFNDAQANAEIVITHNALVSGPQLNVAIPIIVSGDLTKASTLLMKLINDVSSNAPSQGESTNLNMSTFNLNTFIPVKIPLYSYTQQSSNINWIVFGKENAISVNQNTIDKLSKIISSNSNNLEKSGPNIFYNKNGAIKGLSNNKDQIYIDCQPVDVSQEEVDIEKNKNTDNISYDFINPTSILVMQIIASIILFFIILFGLHYGLKYLSKSDVSISKLSLSKFIKKK